MAQKIKLTRMQQEIYDFIAVAVEREGYAPSVREIGAALGLKSPSTVHFHLKHMEEKGAIKKAGRKGRTVKLLPLDDTPVQTAPQSAEQEPPVRRVPIVGSVAAGTPILAQECIEDYLAFDTGGRDGEYFALRVRGESMLNAGILPGDLVVVHQQQEAHNGEIIVALIEDEATVKRLKRKDGQVWLMPENEAYSPIDGRNASILGKVSAVIRTY